MAPEGPSSAVKHCTLLPTLFAMFLTGVVGGGPPAFGDDAPDGRFRWFFEQRGA